MSYLFLVIVLAVMFAILAVASFAKLEISDFNYDRLKWVVLKWSYFVTFIALIVKTFNVPFGVETVTLVAGLGALLSGLLGISSNNYYNARDGIDEDEVFDFDAEEDDDEEDTEEGDE